MLQASKVISQGQGLAPALLKRAATVTLDWDVRQKSRFSVPIELQPDHLKIEPDHVLADMLRAMHLTVVACDAAFEPESGAYAAGGHSHDGHSHSHAPAAAAEPAAKTSYTLNTAAAVPHVHGPGCGHDHGHSH